MEKAKKRRGMIRGRQILVYPGVVKEICEALKVSRSTVWRALRFDDTTELQVKIRDLAIKKGGQIGNGEKAKVM